MRLAVIIPCYNHARYIGAALDSCLAQTRRPDRIIVIDDGSRDDSPAIIRSYADRGVEGSALENRGAHRTINELLAMAALDCGIVSILNSDDHYAPDRFEKCLPLLEANPDKQVAVSALRIIDETDADLAATEPRAKWFRAMWSLHTPERDLCEWLGVGNFPATTSNIMARTAWLQRFPFRPYRFNHDYYFLAQTILRDAMVVHPDALVNYRVHGTNTMNSEPAPLLREMLRMTFDLARDLAPELAADPALRTRWAR
jgi:glycosyltransferase involved in cell wall biosynthesis